jgi:muconate cycloisomerase
VKAVFTLHAPRFPRHEWNMRVVELTAFHVHIPLRKRIRHASHARCATDNLVVRCVLADNTLGFGEGVPREYVTGESIDSALSQLKQSDLVSQLERCRDFRQAVDLAERLRLAPVPGDDRACRSNAARCAVELAILDAYGRRFGMPLAAVTSMLAPDLNEPRPWVRYSGAITSAQGFKVRLAAWRLWVYRFHQIKVKVGIAGQDDVTRLRRIRRRVGPKVDLRVDANEAWPAAEAIERIRALEPFGISAVEQPVPHAEAAALEKVRQQVKVPIMLDESLCSRIDAERAIASKTCDLFNLRLSKCGGFIPTLRLAQLARQHYLGYQLGCQVGETAILSAAGRAFAASVGRLRYVEGSYDRHLIREALATEDITFRWGGWAPALTGPGLGIIVNPAALERVTRRKESLLG